MSSVCLAFSACFEFIEWWSTLALGTAADAFLATQSDVWDTQWDMFACLIGAILAQLLLSRTHDRQLATIQHRPPQTDPARAAQPHVDQLFTPGATTVERLLSAVATCLTW